MIPGNLFTPVPLTNSFRPPNNLPYTALHQTVWGGISIGDALGGRLVKYWTVSYDTDTIRVKPTDGSVVLSLIVQDVKSVGLAFDSNMGIVLTYTKTNGAYLYYFDGITNQYITRFFENVTSSRVCIDDARYFYNTDSDVIFAYTLNNKLYYRRQRDRYDTEFFISNTYKKLIKVGQTITDRLQFELGSNYSAVAPIPMSQPRLTSIVGTLFPLTKPILVSFKGKDQVIGIPTINTFVGQQPTLTTPLLISFKGIDQVVGIPILASLTGSIYSLSSPTLVSIEGQKVPISSPILVSLVGTLFNSQGQTYLSDKPTLVSITGVSVPLSAPRLASISGTIYNLNAPELVSFTGQDTIISPPRLVNFYGDIYALGKPEIVSFVGTLSINKPTMISFVGIPFPITKPMLTSIEGQEVLISRPEIVTILGTLASQTNQSSSSNDLIFYQSQSLDTDIIFDMLIN